MTLWCTVNEPNVQMYQGYVEGIWPPGLRSTEAASAAFAGLVRGHARASTAIREVNPQARIGAAMSLIVFDPLRRWWLPDWIASREADRGFNWAFYDSVKEGAITFRLAGFPAIDEPMAALYGSADFLATRQSSGSIFSELSIFGMRRMLLAKMFSTSNRCA